MACIISCRRRILSIVLLLLTMMVVVVVVAVIVFICVFVVVILIHPPSVAIVVIVVVVIFNVIIIVVAFVIDGQKFYKIFVPGVRYIFCTSTKITQNHHIQLFPRARLHQRKMLIKNLTHQLYHKYYAECRRHAAFWIIWFFDGDTALGHGTKSTTNILKIKMAKIATAGSTRQWILFHHPTYHIYHIWYEDWSWASLFRILWYIESKTDPDYSPKFSLHL